MTTKAAQARNYVMGLDLPPVPVRKRGADGAPVPAAVAFSEAPQAVVVGSQLTEFSAKVSADARSAIADSMLIAQLAANKAADAAADVFAWYRKYIEVLQKVGWKVQDMEFQTQQVSDKNLGVHSAIIPVLMAMLGPGVAAASLVISVLNGLKEMDSSSPWITVFDRASQHAHGAKFQVSYVDADAEGAPQISVMCFGIDAQRTVTQVLFFKFSQDSAEFKKANGKLAMSLAQLAEAREVIAQRVHPFIADYVKGLDI